MAMTCRQRCPSPTIPATPALRLFLLRPLPIIATVPAFLAVVPAATLYSINTDGSRQRPRQSTAVDQPPHQRRRNNNPTPTPTPPAASPAASPATSSPAPASPAPAPPAPTSPAPASPAPASAPAASPAPAPAPAPAPPTALLPVRTAPQLVQPFDLRPMTASCISCGVFHWVAERTHPSTTSSPQFTSCCLNGQIYSTLYHVQEPLEPKPGTALRYAQLYFYDPQYATATHIQANPYLNPQLLQELTVMLYETARDRLRSVEGAHYKYLSL
ncbi:hypothetical protein K469DRAFT_682136 [Zopfia rhizophila CBS 207.26]|uniref:Uncharacterized protein n=1 Tax=Zopfia rhizophila CBS 207.26 TaxID=1314779 RepID=A0A6A6EX78_9PEZI|nr:hypothetical protein K469DRAFT_682136 [Zopfia rhizophila CBS 207.26]